MDGTYTNYNLVFSYHQYFAIYGNLGSGALPGKMLLVKIIENYNNKIDAYFRSD